jgi:hypothetical protein
MVNQKGVATQQPEKLMSINPRAEIVRLAERRKQLQVRDCSDSSSHLSPHRGCSNGFFLYISHGSRWVKNDV